MFWDAIKSYEIDLGASEGPIFFVGKPVPRKRPTFRKFILQKMIQIKAK